MDQALSVFSVASSAANVICDTVTPMTNFKGAKYIGTWFNKITSKIKAINLTHGPASKLNTPILMLLATLQSETPAKL